MRIQATETSAPPAGLPLSIARFAFRRSAERVRTLRFVLSFPSCNAGCCVFFEYCLIHTRQKAEMFLLLFWGAARRPAESEAFGRAGAQRGGGSWQARSACAGRAVGPAGRPKAAKSRPSAALRCVQPFQGWTQAAPPPKKSMKTDFAF